MHKNGRRQDGLVKYKFNKDLDLSIADSFIREWLGYGMACSINLSRRYKVSDRHLIESSALEALMDTFCVLNEKFSSEERWGNGLVIKIIRNSIRSVFRQHCLQAGYVFDKKRVYFPREWVNWEDYFNFQSFVTSFDLFDVKSLMGGGVFTETECLFIDYLLKGFDPVEVSRETGYGSRWVHQVLAKLTGRLKGVAEVDFVPPYKYGRVGPYKKSNIEYCVYMFLMLK